MNTVASAAFGCVCLRDTLDLADWICSCSMVCSSCAAWLQCSHQAMLGLCERCVAPIIVHMWKDVGSKGVSRGRPWCIRRSAAEQDFLSAGASEYTAKLAMCVCCEVDTWISMHKF